MKKKPTVKKKAVSIMMMTMKKKAVLKMKVKMAVGLMKRLKKLMKNR